MRSISDINSAVRWREDIPLERHSLYRKIEDMLDETKPGRVIEVGCGSGRFLVRLRSKGWNVQGVELQPQPEDFILQHDAQEPLPFQEDFDVLLAVEVIEHLVDTDGFLRSCAGALKPGGVVIITTPNLLFLVNRLVMLLGRRPYFAYADFHVRMFVWDDLRAKIERHFTIERLRGSHLLAASRAGLFADLFAWLGDRFPTLAAHFIVVARKLPSPSLP